MVTGMTFAMLPRSPCVQAFRRAKGGYATAMSSIGARLLIAAVAVGAVVALILLLVYSGGGGGGGGGGY